MFMNKIQLFGEPNKNGKLKYFKDDTTYIYIGELYNGKKNG